MEAMHFVVTRISRQIFVCSSSSSSMTGRKTLMLFSWISFKIYAKFMHLARAAKDVTQPLP